MLTFFAYNMNEYNPFEEGRKAKDPSAKKTVLQHVCDGSRSKDQYWSCSHSPFALLPFAILDGSGIAYFDTDDVKETATWIDLFHMTDEELKKCLGVETLEKGRGKKALRLLNSSQEVVFSGYIPAEIIKPVLDSPLVTEVGTNSTYTSFMYDYGNGCNGGMPGLCYYTENMKKGGKKYFQDKAKYFGIYLEKYYGQNVEYASSMILSLRKMWLILRDEMDACGKNKKLPRFYEAPLRRTGHSS